MRAQAPGKKIKKILSNPGLAVPLVGIALNLLSGCDWTPPCAPTAMTEPWTNMSLPMPKDRSAVCASTSDRFQAAYASSTEDVAKIYLDDLPKSGWKLIGRASGHSGGAGIDTREIYFLDFDRGNDQIKVIVQYYRPYNDTTMVYIGKRKCPGACSN